MVKEAEDDEYEIDLANEISLYQASVGVCHWGEDGGGGLRMRGGENRWGKFWKGWWSGRRGRMGMKGGE